MSNEMSILHPPSRAKTRSYLRVSRLGSTQRASAWTTEWTEGNTAPYVFEKKSPVLHRTFPPPPPLTDVLRAGCFPWWDEGMLCASGDFPHSVLRKREMAFCARTATAILQTAE